MSIIPAFDIFSGRFGEEGVVWLGAIERLDDARARMLNLAAKQPGAYFVFNSDSQLIVVLNNPELILFLTQIANSS